MSTERKMYLPSLAALVSSSRRAAAYSLGLAGRNAVVDFVVFLRKRKKKKKPALITDCLTALKVAGKEKCARRLSSKA